MENWMLKLCDGLRSRGDQCLIVGRPSSPWPEACRRQGFPFAPCRFGPDMAPWVILRLRRIMAAFAPDFVVAKGFRQVRFGRLACPRATLATKMPFDVDLTDAWIDRTTVTTCIDRILVDSHRTRRAFLAHSWMLPGKVVAAHNGVMLPDSEQRAVVRKRILMSLSLPADTLLVGGAGRFSPEKRYGDAIEAFSRSAARHPHARLVLFGDGPEREALVAQAVALGIADRVHFPGWNEEARTSLPAFDIVIHPSGKEGLPNVVLEAMAGAAATIATDAGGTEEIFSRPDIGRLYAAGDVAALSRHLAELAGDPDLRHAMGQNARAHAAACFSIDAMTRTIREGMFEARTARQALREASLDAHRSGRCRLESATDAWDDALDAVDAPQAEAVSRSPRSTVVRLTRGGLCFYLKRFRHDPSHKWRHAWRTPEALANFRLAQRLVLAGAQVVPHVAAQWRRRAWDAESVLVTGVVPGAMPLDTQLDTPARLTALRRHGIPAMASWLAHLHAAGIALHDLKAANILVMEPATPTPRFVLLDLDNGRAHRFGGVSRHAVARNLHQCFRSFQRVMTRRDVLRFLAVYRVTSGMRPSPFRQLLDIVEQRLHRRGTGFAELP